MQPMNQQEQPGLEQSPGPSATETRSEFANDLRLSKFFKVSQAVLSFAALAAFVAVIHPDIRSGVRNTLRADYRTVVSTARGDLNGTGSLFTVAKVKTRDNIYLEIFETVVSASESNTGEALGDNGGSVESTLRLVERIELADTRDAFFNFNGANGQATNLAIDDIDGDGRMEILAPTFDRNLVGRLHVFQYDDATRGFSKVIR
ncbi:MAG: hypothetical protein RBT63_00175 [Bdellovibrionales bacterium]|jgi:hypothetical protein|nr:hypothetical protein [Bdellovibrionales bacterium]